MTVHQAKCLSIDQTVFEELKMNGATIQGVYTSTIHLSLKESLITLGYGIGPGKHHIVLDRWLNYYDADVSPGESVRIMNHFIQLGSIAIEIQPEALRIFTPYMKRHRLDLLGMEALKNMRIELLMSPQYKTFASEDASPHVRYQYEKIDIFLNSPGFPSSLSILGLGMGLTPLGDDVLTGFILGLNTVGKTLPWIEKLVMEAKKKTSRLSAQNLKDTYDRFYPDMMIEMIESIMVRHDVNGMMPVLKLGATSGAGIILGFIHGIL